MREVNVGALIRLKHARHLITSKQYRTLRGQVLAGDPEGAMRRLRKLLLRGTNAAKNNVFRETSKNCLTKERNLCIRN